MSQSFIKRLWSKPPQLFPLAALFHIAMLLLSVYNYHDEPFPSIMWVQPLYLLCFTIAWIFICDMKRWAAYAYTILTIINLILRLSLKDTSYINAFTDALFPADVLFTFFVILHFKKFE